MLSRLVWVIEELVPDRLWERIVLLLPPKPRRQRYPGRRPIDDRAALTGIMFVLKTGITWNQLPTALVGGSGVTCWRRRDWTKAGVWPALHELLLAELRAAGELDLDRCAVDGSHIRALTGGPRLTKEPAGVYTHDDGRPLVRYKLAGKSQRELRGLGLLPDKSETTLPRAD